MPAREEMLGTLFLLSRNVSECSAQQENRSSVIADLCHGLSVLDTRVRWSQKRVI